MTKVVRDFLLGVGEMICYMNYLAQNMCSKLLFICFQVLCPKVS